MKKTSLVLNLLTRIKGVFLQEGYAGIKARLDVKLFGKIPVERRYTYHPPIKSQNETGLLATAPSFSMVVVVANTDPLFLAELIVSIEAQWYSHWQLILVTTASSLVETKQSVANVHPAQIKVLNLMPNTGIAAATNAAIEQATGDYIVFLDPADTLTEDCLFELALCIQREAADFIYSDEDSINLKGKYGTPHFKPDWSPDALMSVPYIGHVSCVKRAFLNQVGLLNAAFDGCHDWDLALRIAELTTRIYHIPKVLYHQRKMSASTAVNVNASLLSKKVREAALQRRGLVASVEALPGTAGHFRINYAVQNKPFISIIIPTRDNAAVLRRCLESIQHVTRYQNYEILIIDNGSVKPEAVTYLHAVSEQRQISVIRHDAPFNFSELNNLGVRASTGEILLFLNDDTEVLQADWLERMAGFAQLPHIGAVGAKLLYPGNKRIQHAGVINLHEGPAHAFRMQNADNASYYLRHLLEYNWLAVTGACLMLTRAKFMAVGGFSEELPVAFNDVDLCMRLHTAGLYNVVCQAVRLMHYESISRGHDHQDALKTARLQRELNHLYQRNPNYMGYDPFYNINLHPNNLHFSLHIDE